MGKYTDYFGKYYNKDKEKGSTGSGTSSSSGSGNGSGKYSDYFNKYVSGDVRKKLEEDKRREEAERLEAEERKKVETEVERLRLMRKNAATQARINAATEAQNAQKALEKVRSAARESAAYAKYAGRTAYTDTGSSRDSYEDRVKAAEVAEIRAEKTRSKIRAYASDNRMPTASELRGDSNAPAGAYTDTSTSKYSTARERAAAIENRRKAETDKVKLARGYADLMSIQENPRRDPKADANARLTDEDKDGGSRADIFRRTYRARGYTSEEANTILHYVGESAYGTLAELKQLDKDLVATDPNGETWNGIPITPLEKTRARANEKLDALGITAQQLDDEIKLVTKLKGTHAGDTVRNADNWKKVTGDLTARYSLPSSQTDRAKRESVGALPDNVGQYEGYNEQAARDAGLNDKSVAFMYAALSNGGLLGKDARWMTSDGTTYRSDSDYSYSQLKEFESMVTREEWNAAVNLYAEGKIEELNDWIGLMWDEWTAQKAAQLHNNYGNGFFRSAYAAIRSGLEQFEQGVLGWGSNEKNTLSPTVTMVEGAYIRDELSGAGKLVYDLTNNLAGMAPSILLSYFTGKIAASAGASPQTVQNITGATNAISVGLSAGGNARNAALREGFTSGQATLYGLMVGASEALLERALSPAALGGGLTGVIESAATKINNTFLRIATRAGASALGEFTEEYLQEILEPVFRNICFDEHNEFKPFTEEALYAGILGALSGALIETPHIIKSEAGYASLGKIADIETLKGEAEALGGDAANAAKRLGQRPSNAQKGRFAETVSDARIEAAKGRLKENASLPDSSRALLDNVIEGHVTERTAAKIASDPAALAEFNAITGAEVGDARSVRRVAFEYYETKLSPYAVTKPELYNKKALDKSLKEIDKYANKRAAEENAAYEAAMQTPRSETVGGEYTEDSRAAENYALSPDFGKETEVTTPVQTAPPVQTVEGTTVQGTETVTAPVQNTPVDNKNVITVKRAAVSNTAKAVSRLEKGRSLAESDGRYYVYDGVSVARFDTAPTNTEYNSEDGRVAQLDKILAKPADDTGVTFYPETAADLKTAIAAVKQIKKAYGDRKATVLYNFGDGIVVDAQRALDMAEALPGARISRVDVGGGFYALRFDANNGVGLVMPMNAKTDAAENSVFLGDRSSAPESSAVRLGESSWSPAEGEAAIPVKGEEKLFSDKLEFNFADDAVYNTEENETGAETDTDGKLNTKSEKSLKSSRENTADLEKVRKSAEETPEKVRNIPEKGRNTGKKSTDVDNSATTAENRTESLENDGLSAKKRDNSSKKSDNGSENAAEAATPRQSAAPTDSPRGESSVKKRGGRNVFRDEKGEYREIAGISDDGAVILDGSAELDVDSLDDETRSAVDTILADLYSGNITEAEAVNMLRNGTLTYVKSEESWFTEELNDGNTAELMSPQQIEGLMRRLFGVYSNYGRVRSKNAMGFMKQGEKTIRTRTVGMVPTACHELTHIFDFTMGKNLRNLPGINEVIKAAPQSWLNQYAAAKHASEATAWFGEQYFRSRKEAQKISPEFFRSFEAAFTKSELAKLHELGDVVNRFMVYERDADGNIDTTATIMKQQREQLTSEAEKKDTRSLKERWNDRKRKAESGFFNANSIFENKFGDDASVLYNANIISGAAKATYMINGTDGLVRKGRHSGGFDTADGRHIDDLTTILSPLEEMMKTDKEAYRDFNLYLTALRGGTKVLQGKRVFASDIANRPGEIQNVIDRLESAHPEFREIADKAIEFHRELVKKMCVDTGLMSAEKYEQMAKDDPFYVPFRREVETSSGVPFTKGYLKTEQRYKRMKGSGRDIYNPVESLFQDAYDTVTSSLKAQYGDFILNKVDTDPANWEWLASKVNAKVNMDVTDLTKQRDAFESELKAAGLDQSAVDSIMNIFDGTVGDEVRDFSTPYYQGEQYFLRVRWEDQGDGTQKRVVKCYQFNDPYAADTMKNAIDNSVNMNSRAMNGLLAISKFRKIFLTGSSPLFTVRNLIRDAQDAYAYGRINNPVKFVAEYAKAMKSVISGDETYMRYKKAGGGNSTRLSNDINTVANLIPTVYKAHTKESVQLMRRMVRFAPDMISRANETIEQVPRMMAFKYALEQGMTEEQALFDAANITVNFGQHGANKGFITTMGGVFPFFNAGLQGRYRMYQALKTDPATFLAKKTVTAVVRVGLLTGLIKAFGLEDEYKKLSNYIKNNYYVIPIGKNSFIRLPKDREGGVLDSLIENAVSSLMYGTDGEQWYDYATYLIDQFGGPGTLESVLGYGLETLHDGDGALNVISGIGSDTVLSPIFDIMRNEDYRGVKVENATDQKKVRSERYDENTSSTGKLLGKLGLLSPKQWDHLIKSMGFIPSAVLALPENFAEGGVFGPIKDVGETFKSAFTSSSVYSNDAVNDFYDNFEKLELKKNSTDSGEVRSEYAKASGVKQVINELYAMRRAAESEDEREAITRIIRDTAYDYLHAEDKVDNVRWWTEELYDELGGGNDYSFLFPTAPKAVIKADGVEYSLDLLTYLDYVEEYEKTMDEVYFEVFTDHTKDSAEDQAKYLKEAKEEAEAALKRKYMLKATPSSEKITTDYLKGQIANGYADSGTLKKYVEQERKTREDKGIMQTLANIYKNEYKVAKKSGNNALAKHIRDVLVGLGVGFTVEKIEKWA